MVVDQEKLLRLMRDNPRLSSRAYAELAIENGLAAELDAKELMVRELQKDVRHAAKSSKSDPQMSFISVPDANGEPVFMPAPVATKAEAQRLLDDYGSKIDGLVERATAYRDFFNAKPYRYQLTFAWG